jgi:hypothetical protein
LNKSVRWRTNVLPYLPPCGARDDSVIRPRIYYHYTPILSTCQVLRF